jgi:hypothetical protein
MRTAAEDMQADDDRAYREMLHDNRISQEGEKRADDALYETGVVELNEDQARAVKRFWADWDEDEDARRLDEARGY